MRKILVTGGTGMVGKHLQEILPDAHYIGSKDCDLTSWKEVEYMMFLQQPTHIIHLAAKVGGIQDNLANPAEFFDENILINTHILRACRQYKVKRFIGILSTCAYPDVAGRYPMKEDEMYLGPPAPTNFSYGYAKRCLAVQIDAYNQQYKTKYNYLIPCNLYSEFDNFEDGHKMHFITALLKKLKNLKTETLPVTQEEYAELELLGTGKPLRQFMHANDLARVIKAVIDNDITESFNVAPDYNYSIHEMAKIAIEIANKNCDVIYSKPELDGQYRKDVSSKKLRKILPDFKFINLKDGMKKTYDKIS